MRKIMIAAVLALSALPVPAKDVVPFIQNDFGQAIARGKALHKPIFVEAWAPW